MIENQTAISLMDPLSGNTVVGVRMPAVTIDTPFLAALQNKQCPRALYSAKCSLIDVIIPGMLDDLYLNALN